MSDFENNSSDSDISEGSDVELQEAFAAGLLKQGLNKVVLKKEYVNNKKVLIQKQNDISLNLPWIETLDCVSKPAALAPEMAARMLEHEQKRENQLKNNKKLPQYASNEDPMINDFKREMMFHRQAQATVLEAFPRLHALGIKTSRPSDYFAEMTKSDELMQKVRAELMKQQAQKQSSERMKELRKQKKEGKAIQVQAKLERQKEKREMLEQVKKIRKGSSKDLSFLDGRSKKSIERRNMKDKKFGFGGKKKGMKLNTKDSAADITEYKRPGSMKKPGFKGGKGKVANKRPGKNRRQRNKAKGK